MPAPAASALVDVVDDRDEPIGALERDRVLDEDANFRTAHVLLFDGAGRLLVQQLARGRRRHPLRWGSSVAGYLHAGETYEAAARRRVAEELGIEPPLAWVGRTSMTDEASTKFVGVFRGQVTGEHPRICERDHIERLRWVHLDDLDTELSQEPERFTPTFRHVLAFWRSHD